MQKTKALLVTEKCLRRRIYQNTGMLEIAIDIPKTEQVASHKLLRFDHGRRPNLRSTCWWTLPQAFQATRPLTIYQPILEERSENNLLQRSHKTTHVCMQYGHRTIKCYLRMQKRAARIILNALRIRRTVTLFNNLSWFPFLQWSLHKSLCTCFQKNKNKWNIASLFNKKLR